MRRILAALTRTLALYTFAAWVYVALVALVQPDTLHLQLTHLSTRPRTDTFGEICFVVSLVCYFLHRVLVGPSTRSLSHDT